MKKKAILLVMLVSFLSAAGALFAQETTHPTKIIIKPANAQVQDKIQARIDELAKELNLTAAQKTQVKEILMRAKDQAKVALEEAKTKVKEIRIKAHDDIKALLSEEQKNKFQKTRSTHETVPEVKE